MTRFLMVHGHERKLWKSKIWIIFPGEDNRHTTVPMTQENYKQLGGASFFYPGAVHMWFGHSIGKHMSDSKSILSYRHCPVACHECNSYSAVSLASIYCTRNFFICNIGIPLFSLVSCLYNAIAWINRPNANIRVYSNNEDSIILAFSVLWLASSMQWWPWKKFWKSQMFEFWIFKSLMLT